MPDGEVNDYDYDDENEDNDDESNGMATVKVLNLSCSYCFVINLQKISKIFLSSLSTEAIDLSWFYDIYQCVSRFFLWLLLPLG